MKATKMRVLKFISDYRGTHSAKSPTRQEIVNHFEGTTLAWVERHIHKLGQDGLLEIDRFNLRGLTPTKLGKNRVEHLRWNSTYQERYGVCEQLYEKRIERGWPVQTAKKTRPRGGERFTMDGHYGCIHAHARRIGIAVSTVYSRLKRGVPFNECFVKTTRTANLAELCRQYGIKYSTYLSRISRGKSHEEALKTPVRRWTKKEEKSAQLSPVNRLLCQSWRAAA